MKMKKSVFMIMVAVALASCSENELNPAAEGDDVIRLGAGTRVSGTTTRAPYVGAIGSTNKLTALVPSATASASYDTDKHTVTGTMTFDGGTSTGYDPASLGLPGEARFPSAAPLYLFGLYPATSVWAIDAGGATATATFDGSHDVMAAGEISTDKAEVKSAVAAGTGFKSLTFNHLLTKLEVKMQATSGGLAEITNVQKIELVADATASGTLPTEVTFDPTGVLAPDFASGTNTVATLPFYRITTTAGSTTYTDNSYVGQIYQPQPAAELQAYCLAAPVSASSTVGDDEYYIRITTATGASPVKILPIDLKNVGGSNFSGSTAGYAFSILVNYTVDDILVTATVTDWVSGGETTVPGI